MNSVDFGCGDNKKGFVGIDINPSKNCDVVADINNLPLRKIFHKGYLLETLEHLYNPYEVLKEIKNVLTDDSILIIGIPNIMNIRNFYRWTIEGNKTGSVEHINAFPIMEIRNLLRKAGFDIITIKYGTPSRWYKQPRFSFIPRIFHKSMYLTVTPLKT